MDSAPAAPTPSLPLDCLIPPSPEQPREAASAGGAPSLHERILADPIPMLPAATAPGSVTSGMLTSASCPVLAMPSDILHGMVSELRKADSVRNGIGHVERLRATSRQLRNIIPRPIPEGLLGAIEFNDMAALKKLLAGIGPDYDLAYEALGRKGQLIKCSDPELERAGCFPIVVTIKLGRIEMFDVLFEALAPCRASASDHEIETAVLIPAVVWGTPELVSAVIAAGAKVDVVLPDGLTLLDLAVVKGNAAAVRQLTAAGANVEKLNPYRLTPLFTAARMGHKEVIEALIDAGAAVDRRLTDGRTALLDALLWGRTAAAQTLRNGGAKDYPVFARANEIQGRKEFFQEHAGFPMLMLAAAAGDAQLVTDLLASGADVNKCFYHHDEPFTALFFAVGWGHTEVIMTLLNAGATVEPPTHKGESMLPVAAAAGQVEAVRMLLKAGAAIDKLDAGGRTALTNAACFGHHDVVVCLLQAGAKVDAISFHFTRTALMMAATFGHLAIVETLMRHGAEVSRDDRDRQSPLIFASQAGHVATTKALLQGGANLAHKDKYGMTALDHAIKNGHDAVADLLRGWQ